jgi:ubiquinone biosynthesis protein COQ4
MTVASTLDAPAASPKRGKGLTTGDAHTEYKGRRLRPLAAMRAFGRLVKDKEDTVQVFEIMHALTGRSTPNGYIKLTRRAGDIAFAQEELGERFSDKAWLAAFAPGTVGAAYRDFMERENLTAKGLAQDNVSVSPFVDAPHVYAWYARRVRDIHDVWHILTGYGRDALGEASLVAFSYAQTGNLGFGFLGLATAWRLGKGSPRDVPARRAILEGFRNGRKASWLPAQDYAALFAEPLEAARARLNIATPTLYQSVPMDVRARLSFNG